MFERLNSTQPVQMVEITVNGARVSVPAGIPLAAALLSQSKYPTRTSPVIERDGSKTRAPYCMMGVCFECLVEINGVPNQQGCLVEVHEGMVVRRQAGAADLEDAASKTGAADA